jgi:hypothetical protein
MPSRGDPAFGLLCSPEWSWLIITRDRYVETMLQSFVQALLTLAAAIRHVQSEPAIPGIEALLIERGDEPLQARVMARVIHICGERWARERTEIEKPLAGVLRRLADEAKATPPVVSRRAKALQQWLDRGDDVDVFFRDWLEEAGSRLSTQDLREITMLAANRDESACQRLVEIAEALAPYLPDPRGRRVSTGTGVHLFLILHFGSSSYRPAYTWSDEKEDFVDPLTKATRLFLGDPYFDPRPACRLSRTPAISCWFE